MANPFTRLALKTALAYGILAGLWIGFSDWVLIALFKDAELVARWSTIKGIAFVAITAVLLFAMLRRGMLTLQRETEARMQSDRAMRRWADAFRHCAHGIVINGPVGGIVTSNPAFAEVYGYGPEELAGLSLTGLFAPADRATIEQGIIDADRTGRAHMLVKAVRKNGAEFPAELDVVSVRDDQGALVYRVTSIHEVTERMRTEAALRESETRFRQVVESIKEVFWMVDSKHHQKLYISPAYEEIWGRPAAPLYENSLAWVDAVFEEDQPRVRHALATKLLDGTFDEEFRIRRPDGSTRWIRDRAYPVKDRAGEIERIVGVAEDITERKQLEAQFLRAQRLEAIGTLAGGVAHDLNNILAPMLMAAGLLKESAASERDREMLTMVERSARRGAEIIRQLLTFSRGVEGARVALQARHLVKEIGEIIRETFPREIELVENAPRDLWPVIADATQLHQVLMNLCVNARDAMPRGGKLWMTAENRTLSQVDVHDRPDAKIGRHVLISVADSGTGISPENLTRIFEPFFTTKELGRGTGLGLATVAGIVRSHGGFVRVHSQVGLGSTFEVYLPAANDESDPEVVEATEPAPMGNGELVLVVDDEESIREATRHVLEQHGYTVIAAPDGRVAIDYFLEHKDRIRLVITDVMMPEMGGAALVNALRVLSPTLKVIATSGLEPDEKREELMELGICEMLNKPCASRVLAGAVHRHLHASSL